jgi:CRISPR/Cas system-associated exonuclease Cas4 (RecB family)
MSRYYNAQRTRGLFDPNSKQPFKISRSKIDLFLNCPRCFYIDRRLGVGRPPGFPFHLNSAVDALLKKEFDIHRAKGTKHPLQKSYGIDAVPLRHKDMDSWRENFTGVQYKHTETNMIIFGAVDDVWEKPNKQLIVVDYKATSKDGEVNIDADWQIGYKRQMEIYQWLLRRNGFEVSDTGYFVYCNGRKDKAAFDGKLEFDIKLIPYQGNDGWVERAIREAHACLTTPTIPAADPECDFCNYIDAVGGLSGVKLKDYLPQLRLI